MATKATAAADAPALPAAITLDAPYSGFWDDGSHYTYDAGAVIYDPAVISYFVGRPDALYHEGE